MPVDPFSQNKRLGRGVNILGYDPVWGSRDKGRMQEKHFRLIREAGFHHVRINLHPFRFMGDAPDYKIQSNWLETLDWVLEQCRKNGLLAILDMHEYEAMAKDPVGLLPKFLAFWKQLSARCQNAPDSVLFEILNEPNTKLTAKLWNEFLREALKAIRSSNPTRTVIIGPAFWNDIEYLDGLQLPEDDRNIIVTVHYYHPNSFTFQGAEWSDEYPETGIPWLGTAEEIQAIRDAFEKARMWAETHHRPLYLGEFGAYDKADMDSRVRYTNAVAREAERLGWSWGYWQFDDDFVVYDMESDQWVEPILHALIPPVSST